jgi:hypothetical protein
MAEDRARGKNPAGSICNRSAVERRKSHEDTRIQIRNSPPLEQVQEMAARWLFRSIASSIGFAYRQIEPISWSN